MAETNYGISLLAYEVNKYMKDAEVIPMEEEETGKRCLQIQVKGFKHKAMIPVEIYLKKLESGESLDSLTLMDVLKQVDRAAVKIPMLKQDTYFGEL